MLAQGLGFRLQVLGFKDHASDPVPDCSRFISPVPALQPSQ